MDIDAYERVLPEVTPENAPFWDGAKNGELRLQRADDDGSFRFPPSPVSPTTLSPDFHWEAVSGRGTLWSWIRMNQKYYDCFADELPYVVAFVQLAEGPFLMTTIVDPVESLRIDAPVEVVFETIGDRAIPKFRLVK